MGYVLAFRYCYSALLPEPAPEEERPVLLRQATSGFPDYLEALGRSHEQLKNFKARISQMACLS